MKKFISVFMMMVMTLCFPITEVHASQTTGIDMTKTEALDFDRYNNPQKWKIYYTIGADAGDQVDIQISDIYQAMNAYYQEHFQRDLTTIPGMHFDYEIVIENQSGNDYHYRDGSLTVKGPTMEGETSLDFASTFDGQKLDLKYGAYRTGYSRAIYQGLLGLSSNRQVTYQHILNLEDVLVAKGYQGDNALTQYVLDYYNQSSTYNLDGHQATSILELDQVALNDLVGSQMGGNGTYSVSYQNTTREAVLQVLESNPQFANYAVLLSDNNNAIRFRLLESESELASAMFDYFYDYCYMINISDQKKINANSRDVTYALKKVYENHQGIKDQMNDYLKSTLSDDALLNQNSATFEMETGINGYNTGNAYQHYNYSFTGTITLDKVKEGTVNVHYIDESTNQALKQSDTLSLKEGQEYDVNEWAKKEFDGYYQTRIEGDDLTGIIQGDKNITIYYQPYITDLTVHKVDSANQPLLGSHFTLYQIIDDKQVVVNKSQGESTFVFASLKDGTYRLYEDVTPEGYMPLLEPIDIQIINGKIYQEGQGVDSITVTNVLKPVMVDNQDVTSVPTSDDTPLYYMMVLLGCSIICLYGFKRYYQKKHK